MIRPLLFLAGATPLRHSQRRHPAVSTLRCQPRCESRRWPPHRSRCRPRCRRSDGLRIRANPWRCRFLTNCDSREHDRGPSSGRDGPRLFLFLQICWSEASEKRIGTTAAGMGRESRLTFLPDVTIGVFWAHCPSFRSSSRHLRALPEPTALALWGMRVPGHRRATRAHEGSGDFASPRRSQRNPPNHQNGHAMGA